MITRDNYQSANVPESIKSSDSLIIVVGLFATGKSTLCKKIIDAHPSFRLYKTDQYIQWKENALKIMLNSIAVEQPKRYIIEGAMAYKLLRDNILQPDIVVNCVCSDGTRQQRYLQPDRWNAGRYEGATKVGLKDYKAFDHVYRSMWQQYVDSNPKTRIIQYLSE